MLQRWLLLLTIGIVGFVPVSGEESYSSWFLNKFINVVSDDAHEPPVKQFSPPAEECYVSKSPFKPSRHWPPTDIGLGNTEACPDNKWVSGCYFQTWEINEDDLGKYPGYDAGDRVYLGGCKAAAVDDEELFSTNEKLQKEERHIYMQSLLSNKYGKKEFMITCLCMATKCNTPEGEWEIPGYNATHHAAAAAAEARAATATGSNGSTGSTTVVTQGSSQFQGSSLLQTDEVVTGSWKDQVRPSSYEMPVLLASYPFSSLSIGAHHATMMVSKVVRHLHSWAIQS